MQKKILAVRRRSTLRPPDTLVFPIFYPLVLLTDDDDDDDNDVDE